jgi:hypothetical protein
MVPGADAHGPGGRGDPGTPRSMNILGQVGYWWRTSPGVWSNTLSADSREAPTCVAEAAIHGSLAWLRAWRG